MLFSLTSLGALPPFSRLLPRPSVRAYPHPFPAFFGREPALRFRATIALVAATTTALHSTAFWRCLGFWLEAIYGTGTAVASYDYSLVGFEFKICNCRPRLLREPWTSTCRQAADSASTKLSPASGKSCALCEAFVVTVKYRAWKGRIVAYLVDVEFQIQVTTRHAQRFQVVRQS